SHRYEPLVWILDGTLEIGDNRTYASVEEFVNDEFASLDTTSVSGGSGVLRATAGSVIVVHRNGYFNGDVMPLDETLGGSGEGGGVEGAQARAAVVLNAPQSQRSRTTITVFDSGATGVDINGGHTGTALRLVTRNTRGAAVHWHGDFSGGVSGIFYHDQAEA